MQADDHRDEEKQALCVTDRDVVQERIRRQHAARRQEEKSRVEQADDDRNLHQGENRLRLNLRASIGFGEEEHHQDRPP